jgi:FAD/FMN-containing dehydrogenase
MTIDDLRHAVRGTVIASDNVSFATACDALTWNGRKPARRPSFIVKAACVADVQATVRFAASHGLRISPRGGGHNWSGIARQEGIVLDVSALDSICIDPNARTAEVGPGVTNGQLIGALEPHGLAFPAGHCTPVPVSGYLLGGGFGWNVGEWGIACFGVEHVDVVTADGELRRASETENPDIFWAARGGGPEFFGVVVGYRLRLKVLPKAIVTSVHTYPLAEIEAVVRWMKTAMAVVPANVEFTVAMSSAPPPLAGKVAKVATGIVNVFAHDMAEAEATLARVAALAPTGALDVQQFPTPFGVLYDIIMGFFPKGHRYAADAFWAADKSDDLLRGLAEAVARAPSPRTFALGVVTPSTMPAPSDAAFSMIGPVFASVYSIWDDPQADAANVGWLKQTSDAVLPSTIGHYVGEADLERPDRLRGAYSPEAWAKLKALQKRYDPKGIFQRDAAAVSPAAAQAEAASPSDAEAA